MIIALDGPAGSGKSSTARAVAEQLDFQHLDSGAFYRALTYAALESGMPPDSWAELSPDRLGSLGIEAQPAGRSFQLLLHGRRLAGELRSAEVNRHVSRMAGIPHVREWLLDQLRGLGRDVDLVADGRDIGTVVFPDAELKIFLVAEPETRARRRLRETGTEAPSSERVAAEADRLISRDRTDTRREIAPLRRAPDAIEIDTTRLDFEEQVREVVRLARERMDGADEH